MVDENTEVSSDDAAPVIVGDVDTAPDEVTNEGDTTVIVETPAADAATGDAVEAVVIEETIDQAGRIALLEAEVARLSNEVFQAQLTAEDALAVTEDLADMDEEIIEATDDAIVETIEDAEIDENILGEDTIEVDAIAPVSSRVHPWFRSFGDWRAGRK